MSPQNTHPDEAPILTISGKVFSRSSLNSSPHPSESAILENNPGRIERILSATGWNQLEPGTLNLFEICTKQSDLLLLLQPLIDEDAGTIRYPTEYSYIPAMRIGYLYYDLVLSFREYHVPVLVRRAYNPHDKSVLEVFANINLRKAIGLADGDTVELLVYQTD